MKKNRLKECTFCAQVFPVSVLQVQCFKMFGVEPLPIYSTFTSWAGKERQKRLQTLLLLVALSVKLLGSKNSKGSENKDGRPESALSTSEFKKVGTTKGLVLALSSSSRLVDLTISKPSNLTQKINALFCGTSFRLFLMALLIRDWDGTLNAKNLQYLFHNLRPPTGLLRKDLSSLYMTQIPTTVTSFVASILDPQI